jgi:hypothetical protein
MKNHELKRPFIYVIYILKCLIFCFLLNITCNQPLQVIPNFLCISLAYLPNRSAPNAKPSNKAPMMIIAV